MAFIITAAAGAAIGFIYDFFRVLLNSGSKNKLKYAFLDITFWVIAGISLTCSFYYADNMNLRAYQFLGVFLGLFVYFLLFSRFLIKLHIGIYKIFQLFFKILFTIVKFFAIIITHIFKLVSYPFIKIYKFLVKLSKFVKNKININLKLMRKV